MNRSLCRFWFFVCTLLCVPAMAEDAYLAQLYGQGVHAFHAGNYREAQSLLDEAIDAGSKDPRAYYFRAFTKMQNGWDASSDIQMGANYEIDGYNGRDIGMSLERVQGTCRVKFEKLRGQAKVVARRNRLYRLQQYKLRSNDGERPIDLPIPDVTSPAPGVEQPNNPFADDNSSATTPGEEEVMDDDSLFGADTTDTTEPPAETDTDDALFGDETSTDGATDDLFGDGAGADDAEMFGDPGDEAPLDAGGAEVPADDGGVVDDLFGDGS